jgi:hypothetical protein
MAPRLMELKIREKNNTLNKTGSVRIDVIFSSVRITIVSLKINRYYIFQVCVSSLSYPACNRHVPHLWPFIIYHIFPYYLINDTICRKELFNIKYAF